MQVIFNMPFGKINVYSDDLTIINKVKLIIVPSNYKLKFADVEYNIFIENNAFEPDKTYRATQMLKGIYLGHNLGTPCLLRIENNNIHIYTKDKTYYPAIIWNFVLKYIFSKVALDFNVLHIKGLLLKNAKGKLYLFLGKGNSGKTTLAKNLREYGCAIVSNTHCFIENNYIWGINSWIRERDEKGNSVYLANMDSNEIDCFDGNLEKMFIINYNKENHYHYYKTEKIYAYYYLRNFSTALTNYDLKEEVWDYFSNNFYGCMDYFACEDRMLQYIVNNNDIFCLSMDINASQIAEKFLIDFNF